ncbi:hypothetical protein AGOR_G00038500 [Albula goreensis]|uniref:Uncharacterized protein n=1 Tax=Albula goreensis TaxID=1534307 RepID=A0A8T3E2I0_9TELE|nr:hypothetical protein AGOR_G00038500 [Albula goreensis]
MRPHGATICYGRVEVQHCEPDEITQMVQREFWDLSKEHSTLARDPEVRKEFTRHGDNPDEPKQGDTSAEERQQRSAGKLQKKVPGYGQIGNRDTWPHASDDFPPLPCPAQPWKVGISRDLNADGLHVEFHQFGAAEDRTRRPAGLRDLVKRHPFLERATRPENMVTGAASCGNTHPKHNTVLAEPQACAAPGMPSGEHCRTQPIRPPPGFQAHQHLFPQLFPTPQMAVQPRLSPLQMPTGPPVSQMKFTHEGPSQILFYLSPGQPSLPYVLPGNVLDPSCLPVGGPLWPSATLCRDNLPDNVSPNSFSRRFLTNTVTASSGLQRLDAAFRKH